MKKSIFKTEYSSKAIETIKKIIETEDLPLNIKIGGNALGDTMIFVPGYTEDIKILRDVYEMVK